MDRNNTNNTNNNSWFVATPNNNQVTESNQQQPQAEEDPVQTGEEQQEEVYETPVDGTVVAGQAHLSGNQSGQILLKMLVPAYAAGSVIGKSGQTITHLQKETGVSIKLSKAKDFYPGTTERIALIQGKYEGVTIVLKFIIDKIYEFPIPKDMVMQNAERAKQVKTIVPNTTAGLIIGKKGATIKTIMEQSKAKVQLTQKPDSPNMQQLLERVITVCGEREQLYAASQMILTRIRDDPQSASCPNLSYQNVTGLVANANPTGSPYAPVNEATLLTAANGLGIAAAAAAAAGHTITIPHGVQTMQTATVTQQIQNQNLAGILAGQQLAVAQQHHVAAATHQQAAQQQALTQGSVNTMGNPAAPQNQNPTGYEVYGHYQVPSSSANQIMQQYKTMM